MYCKYLLVMLNCLIFLPSYMSVRVFYSVIILCLFYGPKLSTIKGLYCTAYREHVNVYDL